MPSALSSFLCLLSLFFLFFMLSSQHSIAKETTEETTEERLVESSAASSELKFTAVEWLEKMHEAMKTSPYQGRYVYFDGDQLRTVKLLYANIDGVGHERIVHLDGKLFEILRIGDQVICLRDGKEISKMKHPAFLSRSPGGFAHADIFASYVPSVQGTTRVAGRTAIQIQLTPKDQFRFGYSLWIDRENALLLKSILFGEDNKSMEVFEFTQLDIDSGLSRQDFEYSPAKKTESGVDNSTIGSSGTTSNTSQLDWTVGWLPKGFKSDERSTVRNIDMPPNALGMRTFSDGLSSFSIFLSDQLEEASLKEPRLSGAKVGESAIMRRGVTLVMSGVFPHTRPYRVTFVGELPLAAAENILGSIGIKPRNSAKQYPVMP